jgi:hypothetical protein
MDWLKNHAFLATWASPCIALLLAFLKSKGVAANIDVLGFVLYAISLGSFAALISLPGTYGEKSVFLMLIIFCLASSMNRERR